MNLEEAIKTALEYETRVRDLYVKAMEQVETPEGKKVLRTLAREEQGHLDYLQSRLDHWRETGSLDTPALDTAVPSKEKIDEGIRKLSQGLHEKRDPSADELAVLQRALEAEKETSDFYRRMVDELHEEGRALFARFLEIEEGHLAIVQAEINLLSGNGAWFDFSEINLEMG